ncbi:MAG: Hpt domain-containing protein, partial [Clostridiales bacterium]|nr:Hpt domain-containing protein [Clostridiales bacterium]
MADFDRESMLEMFLFEMNQLIEQLEQTIVQSETEYNADQINEIFRIMHTIKGSAAMMMFDNIAGVAHAIEDLFYYLREESPQNIDYPTLSDHVLEGVDFVKAELIKIQDSEPVDGDGTALSADIKKFLSDLKAGIAPEKPDAKAAESGGFSPASALEQPQQAIGMVPMHRYKAKIMFDDGCEMENIRAYTLVHNLGDLAQDVVHVPEDVIDEEAINIIRRDGFQLEFNSDYPYSQIRDHLSQTVYLKELQLEEIETEQLEADDDLFNETDYAPAINQTAQQASAASQYAEREQAAEQKSVQADDAAAAKKTTASTPSHMINVNVNKLDSLQNLMGELVISEAMVTQNSELEGLQLDSFHKETRQLRKIINDLRSTIMSMRMVPLSGTFFKMNRIVRDMCRQLDKDVQLDIVGEDTEVDKNIIEHISDPIMHIIRNSIDHGVEKPADRRKAGKPEKSHVLLEAKNAGGDVLIIVKDDGAGLDRDKIMKKAKENGLLRKPESEYSDKEIHQFIFLPGFSTND